MTLWGGRFDEDPSDLLWEYTVSTSDRRLLGDDVEGSIAHVRMLAKSGLISVDERDQLTAGLRRILADAADGTFQFEDSDEDVHSAVERRLIELVGDAGKKLHTGRSRNDQVALDMRLYLRRAATQRSTELARFGMTLVRLAATHATTVVASYTHLQQAQAISLGHHLLAYAWMVQRDRSRLEDLRRRLDVSPLGAGASAGSSLPLDPIATAQHLGFDVVFPNSMDAVGARDLVAEYGWCCAQAMVHLSRLSEELILWASAEFGWVTFDDAYTTGSSALPQKKNPDIAELARGKAAGVIGDLTALLVLQKGVPMTYNRDFQEDKEYVFRADDTLSASLTALAGMLESATFEPPPPSPWVTALDLAEALVQRGVPFRDAHAAVGTLVANLVADGRDLSETTEEDLAAADSRFLPEDRERLDARHSVDHRVTMGGGSVESVHQQVQALTALFAI